MKIGKTDFLCQKTIGCDYDWFIALRIVVSDRGTSLFWKPIAGVSYLLSLAIQKKYNDELKVIIFLYPIFNQPTNFIIEAARLANRQNPGGILLRGFCLFGVFRRTPYTSMRKTSAQVPACLQSPSSGPTSKFSINNVVY